MPLQIEEDPKEITAIIHMEHHKNQGKEYEILFNKENYLKHVQNIFLRDEKFQEEENL